MKYNMRFLYDIDKTAKEPERWLQTSQLTPEGSYLHPSGVHTPWSITQSVQVTYTDFTQERH